MTSQVLLTLTAKRHEIESHIIQLEADLEQSRRDLSAKLTATAAFSEEGPLPKIYMNLARRFPRREPPRQCLAALQGSATPLSTREIAAFVIREKGLDGQDRHLRKAIAYEVVNAMRRKERERGLSP